MDTSGGYTNWPNNTARLSQKGGVEVDSSGKYSCEDVYTFVMAWEQRPGIPGVTIIGLPKIGDKLAGFPAPGQDEPDLRPVVNKITFSQPDPAARVWQATVSYGSPTGTTEGEGEDEVELKRISISYRTWTRDLIKGVLTNKRLLNGAWANVGGNAWPNPTAVVNSCGDPFSEPIQYECVTPVIEIMRLEKTKMTKKGLAAHGTINSTEIDVAGVTIPVHAGRLYVTATQTDNPDYAYETTYHIELSMDYADNSPLGWWSTAQDKGKRYRIDVDGGLSDPIEKIVPGANGLDVSPETPTFLDGNGHENAAGAATVYLAFCPYNEASWGSLNLPDDLKD